MTASVYSGRHGDQFLTSGSASASPPSCAMVAASSGASAQGLGLWVLPKSFEDPRQRHLLVPIGTGAIRQSLARTASWHDAAALQQLVAKFLIYICAFTLVDFQY